MRIGGIYDYPACLVKSFAVERNLFASAFSLLHGIEIPFYHIPCACKPMVHAIIMTKFVSRRDVHGVGVRVPDFRERRFQMRICQMSKLPGDETLVDHDRNHVLESVLDPQGLDIEVLPPIVQDESIDIQICLENTIVVEHNSGNIVIISQTIWYSQITRKEWIAIFEEEIRIYRLQKEHVVIEQHEMFGKIIDAMQVKFYGIGMESRQVVRRDIVAVIDKTQFWIRFVEPIRLLSAGHEEYLVHPWGELLHGTEPVAQKTVVPKAAVVVGVAL